MIVRGMGKISVENEEGKRARAIMFSRQFLHERRFGFFEDANVVCTQDITSKSFFNVLRDIEGYAGRIPKTQYTHCKLCAKTDNMGDLHQRAWNGEFVFTPLEGGYLYRWPEGLMHYHEVHGVLEPHWLKALVHDFKLARARGFWKGE